MFKIKENWYDLQAKTLFKVEIPTYILKLWYKEMWRRFWVLCIQDTEKDKQEYLKTTPVFDIDESYAMQEMWLHHFEELEKFFKDKKFERFIYNW